MKRYTLTRTESRRYQRNVGQTAEEIAEDQYAGYSRALASDFDIATETGSVGEVKSTQTELKNGEAGRFRLFKSQHDKLLREDRNGSAFYFFVVIDVSSRPLTARLKRLNPARVGNIIGSRGGWYDAGHVAGKEHKMPIDAIF